MAFRALIKICGTVTALALAGVAHGQSTESPSTTTTGSTGTSVDTTSTTGTTTPSVDDQRPPEALPACPPGEQPPVATAAPPPPPPVAAAPVKRHRNKYFAPHEVSLTTGAGVANYFGGADSPDTIDAGAAWDARLTMGIHSPIALEAAYMGAVNNLDAGNGGHGQVHSNGFDGDVRFQLPTRVQPYVFGGVGYNHMEVRNNGTGAAGNYVGKDDQVTVPAGGGVTAYVGRHVTLDARGTYRFIPDNGITVMSDRHLHQWLAQAHVGYAF
jgi:opacity protein-like surface antigen